MRLKRAIINGRKSALPKARLKKLHVSSVLMECISRLWIQRFVLNQTLITLDALVRSTMSKLKI